MLVPQETKVRQGIQGAIGNDGSQEMMEQLVLKEPIGAQGANGAVGAQGDTGPQGAQGPTGDTGAQGGQGECWGTG